jgi:hypothetical protein
MNSLVDSSRSFVVTPSKFAAVVAPAAAAMMSDFIDLLSAF